MQKIYSDIAKTIGNTPLVRLSRMFRGVPAEVIGKLEEPAEVSTL